MDPCAPPLPETSFTLDLFRLEAGAGTRAGSRFARSAWRSGELGEPRQISATESGHLSVSQNGLRTLLAGASSETKKKPSI